MSRAKKTLGEPDIPLARRGQFVPLISEWLGCGELETWHRRLVGGPRDPIGALQSIGFILRHDKRNCPLHAFFRDPQAHLDEPKCRRDFDGSPSTSLPNRF
jgi:hypothetical protein